MTPLRSLRHNIDPSRSPGRLALGLVAVAAAFALVALAFRAQDGVPGRSYYKLRAQIDGATILPPRGSDVRIGGRRVGQTGAAQLQRGVATIELRLEGSVERLPVDTRVRMRAQGLLGGQYVDVTPGRDATTLPDGGVIPPQRSTAAERIGDVLDALDAPRRQALGQSIRGLGGGVAGRGGALNEALRVLPEGLDEFRTVTRALITPRGRMAELVRDAEAFAAALDPVRERLAATFEPAVATARPFARERRSVEAALDAAPASLEAARQGLSRADLLLGRAERFARATTAFTAAAPRGLKALDAVLRDGRRPLRHAQEVLRNAERAVGPALMLTKALDPALPRLGSSLELARRPSRLLGLHACDITRFGRYWRSWLNYGPTSQGGPLGQLTILRTTLAAGGPAEISATPGSGVDGEIEPCEPDRRGQ